MKKSSIFLLTAVLTIGLLGSACSQNKSSKPEDANTDPAKGNKWDQMKWDQGKWG